MADWSDYRPGHFDRTRLGEREPGMFARSTTQQLPGQAAMFGEEPGGTVTSEPSPDESECLEWQ